MVLGRIKWYDNLKGYGFIKTLDTEVFVHRSALGEEQAKRLKPGDLVEFDLYEGSKPETYLARNVKILD